MCQLAVCIARFQKRRKKRTMMMFEGLTVHFMNRFLLFYSCRFGVKERERELFCENQKLSLAC